MTLALSLLPDIDKIVPWLTHRGITHTLLAAVVAGVVVALLCHPAVAGPSGLGAEHPLVCYLVGGGSVVGHLIGDSITPMGIQPLLPIWRASISLELVQAGSPTANILLVLLGTVAMLGSYSVPVPVPGVEPDEGAVEESAPW